MHEFSERSRKNMPKILIKSRSSREILKPLKLRYGPLSPIPGMTERQVKLPTGHQSPMPMHISEYPPQTFLDLLISKHRISSLNYVEIASRFNKNEELNLTWRTLNPSGSTPDARTGAFLLIFGSSLFLYGGDRSGIQSDLLKLDYINLQWQKIIFKTPAFSALRGQSAVAYKNFIIVYGGCQLFDSGLSIRSCNTLLYIYDTITSNWKAYETIGKSPEPRRSQAAELVGDTLVVYSGLDAYGKMLTDLQVLDINSLTWYDFHITGDVPKCRIKCTLTSIYNSSLTKERGFNIFYIVDQQSSVFNHLSSGLYMFGGLDKSGEAHNELYILRARPYKKSLAVGLNWSRILPQGAVPIARYDHSACTTGTYFIVYGGRNDKLNGEIKGEVCVMKVSVWRWEVINVFGEIPSPRFGAACAAVNGRVLILGGMSLKGFTGGELFELEIAQCN